jgi:23S rRNA (adenine2503-C2)-methyltransferase
MNTESDNIDAAAQDPGADQSSTGRDAAATTKTSVLEQNRDSLRLWFEQQGLPAYRADQVLAWVYQKGVFDIEQMTNLSKELRETLQGRLEVFGGKIVRESRAADGTIKLLLEFPNPQPAVTQNPALSTQDLPSLTPDSGIPNPESRIPTPDSVQVECVMIPQEDRRTACLSTQAWCPVGCVFCASGMHGLQRNLRASEIVEQILRLQQKIGWENRLTHAVIMGMGEPLANFDATLEAIYTINEKWGFGLGARHITLSTVGIPDRIRQLAEHNLQINLAISLHAPTDALRRELIPWASNFKIADIFKAAEHYFDITGREITLEYVLLEGVNDHMTQAQHLAKLAKKIRCSVNLIPYNPVEGLSYKRPSSEKVFAFQTVLRKAGVRTKVRKSRGAETDAACGQLRQRVMKELGNG